MFWLTFYGAVTSYVNRIHIRRQISCLHTSASEIEIEKLLVANRGEIACRVFTTAQRLGIPCVAVFSSADHSSRHVSMADEASWIGTAPSSESYLNHEKVLNVAKKHRATAIHPGYGFLSEDFVFANKCQESGLLFVGPSASAIQSMGDKSEAKQIMRQAKVPVVPGYEGNNQDVDFLIEQGDQTGYPLLVKANMGGGGKGMKKAQNKDELRDAILSAQREALSNFGDSRVILERFIERPRHVEVQILGDSYGNIVHLFERDCSIQRRHQKVIEECPAPNLTSEFRNSICNIAVSAAKAVNYENAGTVEFILDTQTNEFYFMEMNTRLQVEHPVTEWVCGMDLVELQLLVASGQKLPFSQEDITPRGHSIEARLYAEIPHQGFLPGTGVLQKWKIPNHTAEFKLPDKVTGIRIDGGVKTGDEIGVAYDSMIAKIITGGKDRLSAIKQMQEALKQIQVGGLITNLDFLGRIINHSNFKNVNLSTSFISDNHDELLSSAELKPELIALACSVKSLLFQRSNRERDSSSPWASVGSTRLNHNHFTSTKFHTIEGKEYNVDTMSSPDGIFSISDDQSQQTVTVASLSVENGTFHAQLNEDSIFGDCLMFEKGKDYGISIWCPIGNCTLYWKQPYHFLSHSFSLSSSKKSSGIIESPMPGRITKVLVSKGDEVKEGDVLILMEAMKIEHMIKSPIDGEVFSVMVHTDSNVSEGKTLLEIKSTSSSNTMD